MNTDNKAQPSSRLPAWLEPWLNWRRKRCWLLIAFTLYSLAGFFLTPRLLEKQLKAPFEANGRAATVERVNVNPWLFKLEVLGTEIRDTDGVTIFSYDRVFIDFELKSLLRWAWTFREISAQNLYLHEERFQAADTRLGRLLSAFSEAEVAASKAPDDDETAAVPRLIIERLALDQGTFSVRDQAAGNFEASWGPINLSITDLQTLPNRNGQQQMTIETATGGRINWQGELQLVPFRSRGTVQLTGRSLSDFYRYADHFLPFQISGEGVQIDLNYEVALLQGELVASVRDLNATAQGTRLTLHSDAEPLLQLDRVSLMGGTLDWPDQSAGAQALTVNGMALDVTLLPDGSLNLYALIPTVTEPGPAATEDIDPALDWQLTLDRFELTPSLIHLRDEQLPAPLAVDLVDLTLVLSDLNNRPETRMPMTLDMTLSSGGRVALDGQISALPAPTLAGALRLEDVSLPLLQPYLETQLQALLTDGRFSMQAQIEHGPEQLLKAEGALQLAALDLRDGLEEAPLLGWQLLTLDRFEADLSAASLETSELRFSAPYARLHIDEQRRTNVQDLLVMPTDHAPVDEEMALPLERLSIGGIELDGAELDFSDRSLPLPFAAMIQNLNGTISTLATDSQEAATLDLSGQVNEYGEATITGALRPMAPKQQSRIAMVFRNLDMGRLTPYTVQFAGYAIDDGKLDLDLRYEIEDSALQGANDIVIRELTLGDKVDHPDAGSLPLGLAVALLKDANGVIDIDLPVAGNVDDPEFRIGGVVLKAIGNLIAKAVTAPFRLLGGLIGVESEDFGTLSFRPGSAELSPPDQEQLVKLTEAMRERPELSLEVTGRWLESLDRPALAQQALKDQLAAREASLEGGEALLTTTRQRQLLETISAEQMPALDLSEMQMRFTAAPASAPEAEPVLDEPAYIAALEATLVQAQPIDEEALRSLADQRAAAIMQALTAATGEQALTAQLLPSQASEAAGDEASGTPRILLELGVGTRSQP